MEIEMKMRPEGQVVKVYSIDVKSNSAQIFDPESYMKNQGGWKKIKLNKLVPLGYPIYVQGMTSVVHETERNEKEGE